MSDIVEEMDNLWKDIAIDWYGGVEKETEVMAKFLSSYTPQLKQLILKDVLSLIGPDEKPPAEGINYELYKARFYLKAGLCQSARKRYQL